MVPRLCPRCRKAFIKTRRAKVCRKCRRTAYKSRQDEIVRAATAKRREKASAEPVQEMPGLPLQPSTGPM